MANVVKRHSRSLSFHDVDHEQASGILTGVFQENNVFLGGCSFGKGLRKAAHYYLCERLSTMSKPSHLAFPGAEDLDPSCDLTPIEESFYVVDLGVIVSQVYQWRRFFPRVEPFYAVKCNPDPTIVKTLAILGCNFDCASRNEIKLVQDATKDLQRKPDIIYANPCKARAHLIEAVCKGVRMVTFDNVVEVKKCAAVSKKIELVMRIITDDRGSQCRFSSKFGAPPSRWRPLLAAAKQHGLKVVGVSFHVGSGCRDASKYELALQDAKKIFEIAEKEFGMKMNIIDIGGGFPGETHSIWNPAAELDDVDVDEVEGKSASSKSDEEEADEAKDHFMFFTEIAETVAPIIDRMFPPESGVRLIAEPGRYFVAAAASLICSVTAARTNEFDGCFKPEAFQDKEASDALRDLTREEEKEIVGGGHNRGNSLVGGSASLMDDAILSSIQEELADYSQLFASQQLAQQEFDVYNDKLDLYEEGYSTAIDLLGPPRDNHQVGEQHHTAEGISMNLVVASTGEDENPDMSGLLTLAAAGEAAISGIMMQAMADSAPHLDDYAYYINDGVYGAFNNIMFDHAHIRPRVLPRDAIESSQVRARIVDGFLKLESPSDDDDSTEEKSNINNRDLFASTVFGPTCDSIDVIARSVLLPKLSVGDWMYFTNMGAYTMAAASAFNGFTPTEKFYVCSVQPEHFENIIKGPAERNDISEDDDEKKTEQ